MSSIKKNFLRIVKKDKKRGRPSRSEILLTKLMNDAINVPKFNKEMSECMKEMFVYGAGIFDTRKVLK